MGQRHRRSPDAADRLADASGHSRRHSRPYHPQTQGKDERFHRTLNREVLQHFVLRDLAHAQTRFDAWRQVYNLERPHQAIAMATPATRYQASARPFPESLPPIEYASQDQVRRVQQNGTISFRGGSFKIGKALVGQPVALRTTAEDGVFDIYFCQQRTRSINLNINTASVTHVSEHL